MKGQLGQEENVNMRLMKNEGGNTTVYISNKMAWGSINIFILYELYVISSRIPFKTEMQN